MVNPRDTFVESYMNLIESHDFAMTYLQRTAFTIFNVSVKKYALGINDRLPKFKETKSNAKKSKAARKIKSYNVIRFFAHQHIRT